MSYSNNPIFPQSIILGVGVLGVANTNLDGSGALTTVAQVGAQGGRVDRLVAQCTVTNAAGWIAFYINGALYYCVATTAVTIGAGTAPSRYVLSGSGVSPLGLGLIVPSNAIIQASTRIGERWVVWAEGGSF